MTGDSEVQTSSHCGSIRRLLASESYLLGDHLLRLDGEARRRRFGHDVSYDFIRRYALRASEPGNVTFGYVVDGNVRAAGELRPCALLRSDSAEVAFSVERPFANQGIATQLMGRIILTARNRGLHHLVLVCLPENAKMNAIARHYGADLKIESGSVIADIVPKAASYESRVSEFLDDHLVYLQAAFDTQSRVLAGNKF